MPQIPGTRHARSLVFGDSMAISHELSSEIATALLAAKERSPDELDELKKIVCQIHLALERNIEHERSMQQSAAAAAGAATTPSSSNSTESI